MSDKKIELLDIYNKNKKKTGKIIERKVGIILNDEEYINSVQCWIINSHNKILLTRRKLNKKGGGMWEPTTGLVQSGEESIQGIKRELQEEIGIFVSDDELNLISTELDKSGNINFKDGEVIDAKYVDIDEFKEMINNNYIPEYLKYFIDIYKKII